MHFSRISCRRGDGIADGSFSSAKSSKSHVPAGSQLAKIRLQFPEIIYNKIVPVQGEASVEVKLGDSMTRYSIEAFALRCGDAGLATGRDDA